MIDLKVMMLGNLSVLEMTIHSTSIGLGMVGRVIGCWPFGHMKIHQVSMCKSRPRATM